MSRARVPALVCASVLLMVSVGAGASQADEPAAPLPSQPGIAIHEAPDRLELHETGRVTLKATPPAAPGDTVYLNTAGAYNAGYVRVDEAVLDQDLAATLTVPAHEYLGTYPYWVTIPASSTYGEGSSGRFDVKIVPPPPQSDPACGDEAPTKADGTRWVCTFSDDFTGPELDRRYWVPQRTENSGFTTGTRLKYACAYDNYRTVDVADGLLELSLVDLGEVRGCGANKASRYAYGQVMHYQTYSQTYGRYEVRAKIPDIRVPGSQQSFWLWPKTNTYGPWPASGEIDFAELYSSAPGINKPFMHYLPGESPKGTNRNNTHEYCPIKVGKFNTYGAIWEPGKVTILVNDKVCMVNEYDSVVSGEGSNAPFDHPFYLSLNQAMGTIGNDYDGDVLPDRITTQIDYVRIWR